MRLNAMVKGKIIQVSGPVVDVEFEDNNIPFIKDALEVDNNGKRCVMEVAFPPLINLFLVKPFIKRTTMIKDTIYNYPDSPPVCFFHKFGK